MGLKKIDNPVQNTSLSFHVEADNLLRKNFKSVKKLETFFQKNYQNDLWFNYFGADIVYDAKDDKKNLTLREESKTAANKYLYKNLKALKEFEQFLEEAHITAQSGNKLKDSHIIKS